ncbi:hypothetical protein OnM2_01049 [Erysiphe neolycopersici]|uniref:Uncharacterized protein n=1 Tax=Erysiphe neolycopersici TaxID=212602 RepID=A0A420HI48_9PEZI|nr:hypothetical protein OnM2_01049 [Erysiphe neolycopersici]
MEGEMRIIPVAIKKPLLFIITLYIPTVIIVNVIDSVLYCTCGFKTPAFNFKYESGRARQLMSPEKRIYSLLAETARSKIMNNLRVVSFDTTEFDSTI